MSQPITFRIPFSTRFIMGVATVMFVFFMFFPFNEGEGGILLFFAPFALSSLIAFLWSLYCIKITDVDISVTNFLRTQTLPWSEIAKVEHRGDGFRLKNHAEDIVLPVNSQVGDFFIAMDIIKQRTSRAWNIQDITEFHPSGTAIFGFIILACVGIGMASTAISGLFDENGAEIVSIVLLIFSLGPLGLLFLAPIKIAIENEYLVITRLIGKRRIHAKEVDSVSMGQSVQRNAYYYQTHVKLKNGKALQFTSLHEGTFALIASLEKWLYKFNDPINRNR